MSLEFIAQVVNLLGLVVSSGLVSIAVWLLVKHRKKYDSVIISALYIVGTVFVFLSFEQPVDPVAKNIVGRSIIVFGLLIWEVAILLDVRDS